MAAVATSRWRKHGNVAIRNDGRMSASPGASPLVVVREAYHGHMAYGMRFLAKLSFHLQESSLDSLRVGCGVVAGLYFF